MRSYVRFAGATGAVVLLSLTVAACGSSSSSNGSMPGMNQTTMTAAPMATTAAPSADATHNDGDVKFAQDMIVHHQGAIEMAKLAATRASSPPVKTLATRIEAAQGPEITQMTGWLTTWGQPVTAKGSMPGMDMGSGGPMGMMTPAQLKELKAATGKDFDRMFLTMMTTHHKGAIAMATTEQADGSNAAAITLAKSIQTSQTSEVTQMSQLLKNL